MALRYRKYSRRASENSSSTHYAWKEDFTIVIISNSVTHKITIPNTTSDNFRYLPDLALPWPC